MNTLPREITPDIEIFASLLTGQLSVSIKNGWNIMSYVWVWGMIFQKGIPLKASIELHATLRHPSQYDWKIVESNVKPE